MAGFLQMVRLSAMFVMTFILGWGPAVAKFVLVCTNCLISDLDLQTNMYLGAAFNTLFTLKVSMGVLRTTTLAYNILYPIITKPQLNLQSSFSIPTSCVCVCVWYRAVVLNLFKFMHRFRKIPSYYI